MYTIGLDGDDTLWHNEDGFSATGEWFESLLTPWSTVEETRSAINGVQRRNLPLYGYGAKSFALSMIETAIELTDGRIGTDAIRDITEAGRRLIERPAELIDGVADVLDDLHGEFRLLLITKGDHTAQQVKIESSGLAPYFDQIDIVPHKDPETYRRVLGRHRVEPDRFTMVGNSLPSDVLPVVEIGGHGVHVPYHTTWDLERADPHPDIRFDRVEALADIRSVLPDPGATP